MQLLPESPSWHWKPQSILTVSPFTAITRPLLSDVDTDDRNIGFPYPENVSLAKRLETIVRENGGVPATICVLNGIARVGMNAAELDELTSASRQKNVLKVSRRDLGYICGAVCAASQRKLRSIRFAKYE